MVFLPKYKFDGYIFRPATEADLPLAQAWNAADRDHAWEAQYPEYWIEQNSQCNSYLFEDAIGVVLFVKSIRHLGLEIEVNIQFDRRRKMVSQERAMQCMITGFRWLKKALPMNGFKSVYFVSKNESLIRFAEKALGFVNDGMRSVYVFKEEDDGEADSEGPKGNPNQQVCRTEPHLS